MNYLVKKKTKCIEMEAVSNDFQKMATMHRRWCLRLSKSVYNKYQKESCKYNATSDISLLNLLVDVVLCFVIFIKG